MLILVGDRDVISAITFLKALHTQKCASSDIK